MKKPTLTYFLFIFIFLIGCTSKGKYDGKLVFTWEDNRSRKEDEKVIEGRLKKLGIKKYTIHIIDNKTIEVELKNVKDTLKLIQLLNYNDELAFWETHDNSKVYPFLDQLDKSLSLNADTIVDTTYVSSFDTRKKDSLELVRSKLEHPLWAILQCPIEERDHSYYLIPGPQVGYCKIQDTAAINSILRTGYRTFAINQIVLYWTLTQEEDSICSLIALKNKPGSRGGFMNQSAIKETETDEDPMGRKMLILRFDKEGTKLWEKMTRQNIGKFIAITLGDKVVSFPKVEGAITGGVASISGPDPEQFKIIQQGSKMMPFKTKPVIVTHRFEKKN